MNIKKIILSSLLILGCLTASAQEAAKTEYVFNPHWYLQLQGGAQYTLGEVKFKDLISPNAQVTLGYQFSKSFGARLAVNGWQSKAGSEFTNPDATYNWKWNYVSPTIDFTFNLSNLFCGYNPKRVFNFSVFAGAGANIAWKNDEANEIAPLINARHQWTDTKHQALENLWDGTATRFVGQFGVIADFRLCDAVSLGIELQANTLNDNYNSKQADNADWYFNALAGVKINLGKTYTTKIIPPVEPQIKIVEKVVEKIVEKPVPVPAPAPEPQGKKQITDQFHRDVFFTINSSVISKNEGTKVAEIADYMKQNPDMKVTLVGYADKGTGTPEINARLSAQRAAAVKKALISKYGIAESRIVDDSKGDIYQPFVENDKNRVTICVVE